MATIGYKCIITRTGNENKNQLNVLKKQYAQELARITGNPEEDFFCFDTPVNVQAIDDNGTVIGFIAVGFAEQEKRIYISHVYVLPILRNQGVYKMMLARLVKFTQDIGYKAVTAGVYKNNKISQKAHRALGFVPFANLYELKVGEET